MDQFNSLVNQINILAALQGVIIFIALYISKKGDKTANRLLAFAILTFSWTLFYSAMDLSGRLKDYYHIAYTNSLTDYSVGIFLFLYISRITEPYFKITSRALLHFILPLLLGLYYANYFFGSNDVKRTIFSRGYNYFPYDVAVFAYVWVIQFAAYCGAAVFLLIRFRKKIKQYYTTLDKYNYNWLIFYVSIEVLSIVTCFIFFGFHIDYFGDIANLIGAVLIYGTGYRMLTQPAEAPAGDLQHFIADEMEAKSNASKYERSGLTPEKANSFYLKLEEFMDKEKPYLQPELTLKQLSEAVGIAPHHLSQVINQNTKGNFYDYINGLRVNAIKEKLVDPTYSHYTVLSLAFDCGFNSKAAFNLVFKKVTGMSPSEFRKTVAGTLQEI